MPRPERRCEPNLTYHTMSRCIDWKDMMKADKFKAIFIQVIRKTQEKYEFELVFYQIMDNHFHLVIRTISEKITISRVMQYIKARFAEIFNKMMNRHGPFWNERFKDIIAEEQKNPFNYVLWLLWYLAFNPVRKRTASNPRTYRFSSIQAYLEENVFLPVKITLHYHFLSLGNTFEECVKKFLYFEEAYRRRWPIYFAEDAVI